MAKYLMYKSGTRSASFFGSYIDLDTWIPIIEENEEVYRVKPTKSSAHSLINIGKKREMEGSVIVKEEFDTTDDDRYLDSLLIKTT